MSRREKAIDLVKEILLFVVVVALLFIYWMAVLLIISLVLLNVWVVSFDTILNISIGLTILSAAVYVVRRVMKHKKEMRVTAYMEK